MNLIDQFAIALAPEVARKHPTLLDGDRSHSHELAEKVYKIAKAFVRESMKKGNQINPPIQSSINP